MIAKEHKGAMMVKKKDLLEWGALIVILVIAIAFDLLTSILAAPQQIPSDTNLIVFKTGIGLVLRYIFFGVIWVAGTIVLLLLVYTVFKKPTSLSDKGVIVGITLMNLAAGMYLAYIIASDPISYGEEITIDTGSEILIEREFYLSGKPAVKRIPFADITHVEYEESKIPYQYGFRFEWSVILRLVGGDEVDLSTGVQKIQYSLAGAISKATDKPLIVSN